MRWLSLGDSWQPLYEEMRQALADHAFVKMNPVQDRVWMDDLIDVLDNKKPLTTMKIVMHGTPFQEQVWHALRAIPSGQTCSYKDLAVTIGRPTASHAVGGAVGANQIAVLIPCHRVVRSDGDMCGFRWGVERKRALQARETPQQQLDIF